LRIENKESEIVLLDVTANEIGRVEQALPKSQNNQKYQQYCRKQGDRQDRQKKMEVKSENELVPAHALCTCSLIGSPVVLEC
jgi:hypothetical protein